MIREARHLLRTPFVLEGRVPHLSLLFTRGLRFEGLTRHELQLEHREAIKRGETEGDFITLHEGTPEERKIDSWGESIFMACGR